MQTNRANRFAMVLVFSVLPFVLPGCAQSGTDGKGREFVHGFAEYNMTDKELDGLLSKRIDANPSIYPDCYIGNLDEQEFVLKMRGLLPTAVPHLDKKMTQNFICDSFRDELQVVKSQSIPFFRGGVSGIAYWPRVKHGFHDVETGRSGYKTSEYRLRQVDAIADGYALVDHADQDHMFYDTYSAAERFAKEHRNGYWGLSAVERDEVDVVRREQKVHQNEIWKFLDGLEWETISVESSKMKRIWTIGTRDKETFALLAFDSQGQTVEDRFDVELRGILPTGNVELDSKARGLLTRKKTHCYILRDSIERVSNQKIKGIVYHAAYSLNEEGDQEPGELSVDTYRTWQPLAVALGYCLVDHNDRTHPLYETLVKAEKLAKRLKIGYWRLDSKELSFVEPAL